MPTLADLVVRRLGGAGVRTLFGMPGGGGNLDLIEAAGRAGLPFVMTATETGGALAALAQAEVTGACGACLTTLGPGAASVVNGIAAARLERAPVMVFTDSHASGAWPHQRLDHTALFAPITTWTGRLEPGDPRLALDAAFAALASRPPGPVHLDCPGDLGGAVRGLDDEPAPLAPEDAAPEPPEERARWAALASASRRPIVIAGLGARASADAAALRAFCARRGIPALVTYKAKGVVPDGHPCFAGVFTGGAIERPVVGDSDLIVGVGLDPVELLPRAWPYPQPVIHLGPWRVDPAHVPFAAQRTGPLAGLLADLDASLPDTDWDLTGVAARVAAQRRAIDLPGEDLTAQRVVRLAAARLAASHRVAVDAGAHMFAATMLWPASEPNGLLISNGLSTMGFALPGAIGAALADPGRPVVALTGDGGLLMCAGELATAARERLRVIVVVLRDDRLSLIDIKQRQRGFRPAGVDLAPVDWTALAAAAGLAAFRAATAAEFDGALDRAADAGGPSLIEARIDPANYAATLAAIRG